MLVDIKDALEWSLKNSYTFSNNPAGLNRKFRIFNDSDLPKEFKEIKQKIISFFNLKDAQQEPVFKDFCGFITETGFVHKHKDPNKDGLIHTRFNVLLSKPISGGIPVIDGKEINVTEGEVWECKAGIYEHWTTPVVGSKPRIVLSFGFLL